MAGKQIHRTTRKARFPKERLPTLVTVDLVVVFNASFRFPSASLSEHGSLPPLNPQRKCRSRSVLHNRVATRGRR